MLTGKNQGSKAKVTLTLESLTAVAKLVIAPKECPLTIILSVSIENLEENPSFVCKKSSWNNSSIR